MSESLLRDIGVYKQRLLSAIQSSNDIMELMLGKNFTDEQVYGNNDDVNDFGIVYKQIFPYLYIDDTQKSVKSYLCIEVDIPRVPTATIKDMKIIIWAYCHKSYMKYYKDGFIGTCTDILSDMVERELQDSEKFGIGKLHLESATYFSPSKEYYGRQLIFSTSDFKYKRGNPL